MTSNEETIVELQAKITALTMLVEALWAESVAQSDDPRMFAQAFLDRVLQAEARAPDHPHARKYSMLISNALTSLVLF